MKQDQTASSEQIMQFISRSPFLCNANASKVNKNVETEQRVDNCSPVAGICLNGCKETINTQCGNLCHPGHQNIVPKTQYLKQTASAMML